MVKATCLQTGFVPGYQSAGPGSSRFNTVCNQYTKHGQQNMIRTIRQTLEKHIIKFTNA